ncbi:MAG: hypothetical protein J6B08_06840 [Ruminiclostridium sp.]|nr:hypothetical protein [Ruminiclostridium sp.]
MKKIICVILSVLIFVPVLGLSASAAIGLDRLPVDSTGNKEAVVSPDVVAPSKSDEVAILSKSVKINANLIIEEDETLVIPKNKRLTLRKGKTLTVKGTIFVENGGSLIIEKGNLKITENAEIISNGKISVSKASRLVSESNSLLFCGEKSTLDIKGKFEPEGYESYVTVALGKYDGSYESIATDVLASVSFNETGLTGGGDNFKSYSAKETEKLIPDNFSFPRSSKNPAGGVHTHLNVFFSNGQTLTFLFPYENIENAEGFILGDVKISI